MCINHFLDFTYCVSIWLFKTKTEIHNPMQNQVFLFLSLFNYLLQILWKT